MACGLGSEGDPTHVSTTCQHVDIAARLRNTTPAKRTCCFYMLFENNRCHLSLPTSPMSDTHGELICIWHLRLSDP